MEKYIYEKFIESPVIAAVRDEESLEAAVNSPVEVIFILKSSIRNFKKMISKIKSKGKLAFIHIDLIEGLGNDDIALEFINDEANPHGIITVKRNLITTGKSLGLCTIQRMFLVDSLSITNAVNMAKLTRPDAVEIMPGIIPNVIKILKKELTVPIITGGMISTKEEVIMALKSGSLAVSVSKQDIWNL